MATGVILAGGRSTRFGEVDKAVADISGTPMIRRVADRLMNAVDSLVINCRADQTEPISGALDSLSTDVAFAIDETPDRGPLAGIHTGLSKSQTPYTAIVACDMPFVDPPFIDYLLDVATGYDGAVPQLSDGWFQTTQAVYRTEPMAAACASALDRDAGRIVAAFDELDIRVVAEDEVTDITDLRTFDNINTQAELTEAESRLSDS